MKTATNETAVLFVRNIDPHLKAAFKIWCVQQGRSMNGVMLELMIRLSNGDKKITVKDLLASVPEFSRADNFR